MNGPRTRRTRQHIFKTDDAESDVLKAGARRAGMKFAAWCRAILLAAALETASVEPRTEPTIE